MRTDLKSVGAEVLIDKRTKTKNDDAPEFIRGPVATEEVGTDAEKDAEEQRKRVEDVDDARQVRNGEQRRTEDHHVARPYR